MSAPQLHLRSGPSTTTQPSQTATSTRIEVASTLRLRGVSAEGRRIRWAEDVVDNEGMGRKSSKGACPNSTSLAVLRNLGSNKSNTSPRVQSAAYTTLHVLSANPPLNPPQTPRLPMATATVNPIIVLLGWAGSAERGGNTIIIMTMRTMILARRTVIPRNSQTQARVRRQEQKQKQREGERGKDRGAREARMLTRRCLEYLGHRLWFRSRKEYTR